MCERERGDRVALECRRERERNGRRMSDQAESSAVPGSSGEPPSSDPGSEEKVSVSPSETKEATTASAGEAPESEVFGVQVTDLSAQATEQHLREFFHFSGKITDVQVSPAEDGLQQAMILFEKQEEAETACLLTGAIIIDRQVVIANISYGAPPPVMGKKAVDVISQMLSAGFVLGKSTYDKLSDFDKKIGLSERVKANIKTAKERLSQFDEKHQLGTKAKTFLTRARTSFEGAVQKADDKFKFSERFTTTSQTVQSNENVQKATKGIKYGFSTIAANISKVSNATSTKIKKQLNKDEPQ